jgi:segregation and condensation protein B
MAFDLRTTLRVLLFASPGPLTIQDIQRVFTRYHERQDEIATEAEEEASRLEASGASAEEAASAAEAIARAYQQAEASKEEPLPPPIEGTEPPAEPSPQQATLPGIRPGRPPTDVPTLITASQIRDAIRDIEADLRASGDICTVREGPSGFRLHVLPEYAEWVRCLRDDPPPVKLSQSNLETLAVIAYRQPTTRSEIEAIRGVSCENSVNKLLDRGLIRITGRAELPGRPIQYGTTEAFLDFVGVKSLADLPASDVLSRREVDAWLASDPANRKVGDKDVGLPGLEEELSAASAKILADEAAATPTDSAVDEAPQSLESYGDSPPADDAGEVRTP